jgi:hypothetical protein
MLTQSQAILFCDWTQELVTMTTCLVAQPTTLNLLKIIGEVVNLLRDLFRQINLFLDRMMTNGNNYDISRVGGDGQATDAVKSVPADQVKETVKDIEKKGDIAVVKPSDSK